ncbi:MAG: type IV pilin protein [Stenotrophobium sp.]
MNRQTGFTLMELVIAVAIIGILAAIALPSYQQYVMRGNRTVAKNLLMDISSREESYFGDRKQYAASLANLNYAAATVFVNASGVTSATDDGSNIYSVTLSAATATTYTITATPINRQTNDNLCGALSLDSTGNKTAAGSNGSGCWQS